MGWPEGNQYYLLAEDRIGRPKKYTPRKLLQKANEYFTWVLANPLIEAQVVRGEFVETEFTNKGKTVTKTPYTFASVPKMRPFTLEGLCNFADISVVTFHHYWNMHSKVAEDKESTDKQKKQGAEFLEVCTRIKQMIDNHQFEGAASGFLNHAIIARKLGLADKKEIQGNPDQPFTMVKRKVVISQHEKGKK